MREGLLIASAPKGIGDIGRSYVGGGGGVDLCVSGGFAVGFGDIQSGGGANKGG
jgi:hypothetical protein